MKRTALFLFILIFCAAAASATPPPFPEVSSVSSQATFGLFTNELDAAATVDEPSTGPVFTELDRSYLFTGVSGNIQQMDGNDFNAQFNLGYYNAAERPWSLFSYFNFALADTANPALQTDNGAGITTDYTFPSYDQIQVGLSFLKAFSGLSSGLELDLDLNNNIDPADNYTQTDSNANTTLEEFDKNGGGQDFGLTIPLFLRTGNLRHYGEVRYGYDRTDNSAGVTASAGGVTVEMTTTSKTGIHSPSLLYKLTVPAAGGELVPFAYFSLDATSVKIDGRDNTGPTDLRFEQTSKYSAGFDMALGCDYFLILQPTRSGWLQFRIQPGFRYILDTTGYEKSRDTVNRSNGTVTADQSISGLKDSDVTNTITGILEAAIEIKPENWFLGLSFGSQAELSWARTAQENITGDVTDNLTGVTIPGGITTKSINTDWTSDIDTNIGFFIPLPEDYRLDFALFGNNFFNFEQVIIQLIVPLK